MKEQIKDLRVKIDGLSQLVKELHPFEDIPNNSYIIAITNTKGKTVYKMPMTSDELRKCADSLLLGKAWLGKLLGELGVETPYKNDGKRTDVNSIEPTADRLDLTDKSIKDYITMGEALQNCSKDYNLLNHIEKVDWLRQEIEKTIIEIKLFKQELHAHLDGKVSIECNIARTNCYNHLCEARFWLGFELQRIKENESSPNNIRV